MQNNYQVIAERQTLLYQFQINYQLWQRNTLPLNFTSISHRLLKIPPPHQLAKSTYRSYAVLRAPLLLAQSSKCRLSSRGSQAVSCVAFLSMVFFLFTRYSRLSQNFCSLLLRGGLYKLVIKCALQLVLIFMVSTSISSGFMKVRSFTMSKSVPDFMQNATPPPF